MRLYTNYTILNIIYYILYYILFHVLCLFNLDIIRNFVNLFLDYYGNDCIFPLYVYVVFGGLLQGSCKTFKDFRRPV